MVSGLEYLNLSGLDLGDACSPGPASDGSQWSNPEPEQCGQEGHRHTLVHVYTTYMTCSLWLYHKYSALSLAEINAK